MHSVGSGQAGIGSEGAAAVAAVRCGRKSTPIVTRRSALSCAPALVRYSSGFFLDLDELGP